MRLGRRFFSFWLLLLTACVSGCCGCGACGDCGDGCNIRPIDFCADGSCDFGSNGDSGRSDAGRLVDAVPIATDLEGPTALVSDGTEVFYVDRGELFVVDSDGSSSATLLASGVGNVGNIVTDGFFVYWAGTWSDELSDAGVDAGDAASDVDAADDAGDAGTVSNPGVPGVFRVQINDGAIARVATLDALPTIETAGTFLWLRARTDDAGASALGMLDEDDGGFSPVAALQGNTENMHAFAIGPNGMVALDADGIVRIVDGGKSLLATGATGSALLATATAAIDVTGDDASFRVLSLDDGINFTGVGALSAVGAYGDRIFLADRAAAVIYVYPADQLLFAPAVVPTTGVVSLLAADDDFVYWASAGSIYRSHIP